MLPKDYVRFRLTGERATDMADASGTLMLDVAGRRWSEEVAAGDRHRHRAVLPALHESPDVCATIFAAGAGRVRPRGRAPRWSPAPAIKPPGATGMGIVAPGAGQRHHRDVGRRLCRHRSAGGRSARPAAHVLPRRSRADGT